MSNSRGMRIAALALLFGLPLALRFWSIDHGGERGYVPDAHIVRSALGMARDHDLVPPVGKYSTYPNLLPYLLLPCYVAQFLIGCLTGAWKSIQDFTTYALEHPQHLAWTARGLIALFGALTTWVIYRAARAAGMKSGAWIAAWLTATGLLDVQLSTHERPWAAMMFFIALSAWAAIVHAKTAETRPLALSGLFGGLAFACHQAGLGALAIPFFAWILGPLAWKGPALRVRLVSGVLAVLLFLIAGIVIGNPYLLVHGRTPTAVVVGGDQIAQHGGFSIGGMSVVFEMRWESVARLARSLFGYDPVVVLLGLGGIAFALRDRRLRAVACFTLLWAVFFLTNKSDHVRYLLPVAVLLALPAGLAAERWLAQPFGRASVALLLLVPLVQAMRFDLVLGRMDTRAEAETLLARLPKGSVVAIDRYGPEVDLDRASLVRLERIRNSLHEPLRNRELERKRRFDAGAIDSGCNAMRIEELFEIDERAGTVQVKPGLAPLGDTPLSVLKTLGVTHVLFVEREPGRIDPFRASLANSTEPAGKALWSIDPSTPRAHTREARLPTEMDFPLSALWSVDRPGPRLELVVQN